MIFKKRVIGVMVVSVGILFGSSFANPVLKPGTWVNITPPVDLSAGSSVTYGFIDIKFDPQNRSTLYGCVDREGLWKSTDGGATWARIGLDAVGDDDSPQQIQIDPNNGQHLFMVNGVRGTNEGFWVSTDGGNTWNMPAGFRTTCLASPVGNLDCYSVAVDPTDFNHAIVSFHSAWSGTGADNCGVVESKDGGNTWSVAMPPAGSGGPGFGVVFLYDTDSAHPQGDGKTWLLATQGTGLFRTSDAGNTWTQVTTQSMTHGAFDPHYISNGYIYVGLNTYPTLGMQIARSTDNGLTWQAAGGNTPMGEYQYYHSVIGDGYRLYTKVGLFACSPYMTSLETDGETWTNYNDQDFGPVSSTVGCGPTHQIFDSVNGIIYSADWGAGVWALKVVPPPTSVAKPTSFLTRNNLNRLGSQKAGSVFDINGRMVGWNAPGNGKSIHPCGVYILKAADGLTMREMVQK